MSLSEKHRRLGLIRLRASILRARRDRTERPELCFRGEPLDVVDVFELNELTGLSLAEMGGVDDE